MKRLLLCAILLVASYSSARSGSPAWSPRTEVLAEAQAWATNCTAEYRHAPVDLSRVVWHLVPDGSLGERSVGRWLPPDTLAVVESYADTAWVLAHELTHYILQDPDHPWNPFSFPCQLMPFQQRSGGILNDHMR